MITKEQFFDLVKIQEETDKFLDATERLNISLIDTKLFDSYGRVFDLVISSSFPEVITDIINEHLYENLNELEDNGQHVSIATTEELWDYVKDFRN